MRVAVTGGSGFIGSHVVDKLIAAAHQVTVLDVRVPHRDDVTHLDVDIRDQVELVRALRGQNAVIHLAAVANVNDAHLDPVTTFDLNVSGTSRVWEAARRNDLSLAVLASTVWIYGGSPGQGLLEESAAFSITGNEHVYTASKLAAELVVTSYAELYGVPYTIMRYGIPYGPRMRDELVIARFVKLALEGRSVVIHGDGLQFRDYVYVEDLAEAHVHVLERAEARGRTLNIAGREQVSVTEVAEVVRDLVDANLLIEHVPSRPGDFAGRPVSTTAAFDCLGWQATTSFLDGVKRYVEWVTGDQDLAETRHA
jgi:UDP-glucose 4-epimerase